MPLPMHLIAAGAGDWEILEFVSAKFDVSIVFAMTGAPKPTIARKPKAVICAITRRKRKWKSLFSMDRFFTQKRRRTIFAMLTKKVHQLWNSFNVLVKLEA